MAYSSAFFGMHNHPGGMYTTNILFCLIIIVVGAILYIEIYSGVYCSPQDSYITSLSITCDRALIAPSPVRLVKLCQLLASTLLYS